MKRTALALCLFLVLLAPLMSLLQFESVPASAEASISKPSVPEFTVKFVNASYSVTTTNPYTGLSETKLTSNNSIEITIKNQRFDYSNNQIYYNIRTKPHFADNWTEIYHLRNITSSYNGNDAFSYALYIVDSSPQSKSSYTVITFPVVATELYSASGYDIQRYYSGTEGQEGTYFAFLSAIPDGAQLDFQVGALVGHDSQMWVIEHPFYPTIGGHFSSAVAYDATSDWSNTQTITINGNASTTAPTTSPSQYSTTTPDSQSDAGQQGVNWTEISLFAALGVIVALIIVIMLMYRK
jgi:hypothetical protein